MALFNFKKNKSRTETASGLVSLLRNFSIEVMPRTAEKVENFSAILPKSTRVYIAHIEGTPIEDMVKTAVRLSKDGFEVMPHFPARIIQNKSVLADWISRYQNEANVSQALILAGGIPKPIGDFDSSMQLLETGLFDKTGFTRIHFAGHPEGNKDIEENRGDYSVESALKWKQAYSDRTDVKVGLATQFLFEAKPIIDWARKLSTAGIDIPIHIGIAGPAKLQTLIKFAIECGVGASLGVLQKRARDLTKLLLPYEPTEILNSLVDELEKDRNLNIEQIHFFPLGGIKTNATWISNNSGKLEPPKI
jgi:methylenetetrahydrofolate reductase (NADPH)